MKRKHLDIFLICFFILLVIGFIVALNYYKSEGNKCMNDPLSYSHNKLIEANPDYNIECACNVYSMGVPKKLCGATSCPLKDYYFDLPEIE